MNIFSSGFTDCTSRDRSTSSKPKTKELPPCCGARKSSSQRPLAPEAMYAGQVAPELRSDDSMVAASPHGVVNSPENDFLALRALLRSNRIEPETKMSIGVPLGRLELPGDFFEKLAEYVKRDLEIQRQMMNTGDAHWSQWCGSESMCSSFLLACVEDRQHAAWRLWQALDKRDKQDLLMTYSLGPPSPDFIYNMMRSPRSDYDSCSGSSQDFEEFPVRIS